MGLFSDIIKKAKEVVSGAAKVVTKTAQTVIPGGNKGYLEPSKPATPTPTQTTKSSSSSSSNKFTDLISNQPKTFNDLIAQGGTTVGNSYDPKTMTYTGQSGNKYSMAQENVPQGTTILGQTQSAQTGQSTQEGAIQSPNGNGNITYDALGQPMSSMQTQTQPQATATTYDQYGRAQNPINPATGKPYTQAQKAIEGLRFMGGIFTGETKWSDISGRLDDSEKSFLRGIGLAGAIASISAAATYFIGTGTSALTAKGASTLASGSAEAAGVAPAVTTAGGVTPNTATAAKGIGAISKALKDNQLLSLGAIVSTLYQTTTGSTTVETRLTKFLKESGDALVTLRENGMDSEAYEIESMMKDLQDGWDKITPLIPWIGKGKEIGKIEEYQRTLDNYIRQSEALVKQQEEKDKALLEMQKVENEQDTGNYYGKNYLGTGLSGSDFDRKLREAEAEEDDQDPNNYYGKNWQNSGLSGSDYDRKVSAGELEATGVETTGTSNLDFGLLRSGGDVQFVDRDKAAQYYFGKVFEELTPAQRKLLMLSKGAQ